MKISSKNAQTLNCFASLTCRWASRAAALTFLLLQSANDPVLGQSEKASPHCKQVGGAFVTNFIAPDQTAGVATGDLKGALGVKVLSVVSGVVGTGTPVVLRVLHFWVTESGDTLLLGEADLTAYPAGSPSRPLLYTAVYEQDIEVTGGTGRFEGATGVIKAWGAADLGRGEVAGRYSGEICFKAPAKP